jgi:hypothetical protein
VKKRKSEKLLILALTLIYKSSNFSKYFGVDVITMLIVLPFWWCTIRHLEMTIPYRVHDSVNADLSKIHIINNIKCNCVASFEDAMHYFLECPLYLNERRTLLSNCDDININIETHLDRAVFFSTSTLSQ